ncbi:MAG TPA: aminotransferase class I/II-fold pyridoxal phosphate-dependent enzyme [Actinomycetota bacterium]|jgi:methionine-gamma-lyase|nr:aminotransferase class I/II-fold pyridoxal phosphate-dependent enzyme [Actinomycetota bacterium]
MASEGPGGVPRFATRAVHPPKPRAQPGSPVAPIIDPSSTYAFDRSETFAEASKARTGKGYVYSRWANPTVDAFEAAVADLEGMEAAEAFASGMAAISAVFLGLCGAGDRVVASRSLYGNTHSLLTERLPRYGITATLIDLDDFESFGAALAGAKLLYCETIGNPRIQVADLPRLADLAHGAGVPLVVDNTFASPWLCRPREHGADISLHSATKFLGGHHDLLGGVVCADEDLLAPIRAVARDIGPTLSPFTAWLALRGMATLQLRVERSSDNALRVAEALARRPDVSKVHYPALKDDPSKERCNRLLGGRGGGTLGFDVSGGRERSARFQEALRVVTPAASLGGSHSLIVHPASVTHTQLSARELEAAGISEGFCRLSVGLEDPDDLISDLTGALDATR